MNRVRVAVTAAASVVVLSVATAAFATSAHHPATSHSSTSVSSTVQFSGITVTAAGAHRESAIVMSVKNASSGPITLMSVSSPVAGMDMLYYDANMCQGNSAMQWLANIFITPHQTQQLGYKNQGVMLSLLRQPLKVGETIPLKVKYSDFTSARTVVVRARVVAPPHGLHFVMSSMKM